VDHRDAPRPPLRAILAAAAVHAFTALGVLCALMALRAALGGAWEDLFVWLAIALLIDGLDGTLARMANIEKVLPRFSGERLDLIIDYLTYVFVPALALVLGGFLEGTFGLILAGAILLSSLFHFSDTESKTADYCFVGFPALWNVVAFFAFALALPPWLVALVVATGVVLTFAPLKWAHPMRTPLLRPLTLLVMAAGAGAAVLTLWSGFPATPTLKAILILAAAYMLGHVLYRSLAR
jgi:phosphatidylcholine synthase